MTQDPSAGGSKARNGHHISALHICRPGNSAKCFWKLNLSAENFEINALKCIIFKKSVVDYGEFCAKTKESLKYSYIKAEKHIEAGDF